MRLDECALFAFRTGCACLVCVDSLWVESSNFVGIKADLLTKNFNSIDMIRRRASMNDFHAEGRSNMRLQACFFSLFMRLL